MPRRPATVTQADISRAIRAAKGAGAAGIVLRPDGTILIDLSTEIAKSRAKEPEGTVDDGGEIVL
jgi:thymidylate kinase